MCFAPQRRSLFWHLNFKKNVPEPPVFNTFDFEICFAPQWRKSVPSMVCFVHFYLGAPCAPHRRAFLPYFNFQTCSEHEVSSTFWLRNPFHTTTACNFSPLISPVGSAPTILPSLLFDLLEPQNVGKTQCCTIFPTFRAPAFFFLMFLFGGVFLPCSSLTLPTSAFHLSKSSKLLFGLRQNLYEEQLNQILGKWHTPRVCTQPPVVQCCLAVMNVGLEKCHVWQRFAFKRQFWHITRFMVCWNLTSKLCGNRTWCSH